jgi:hypothetical protein
MHSQTFGLTFAVLGNYIIVRKNKKWFQDADDRGRDGNHMMRTSAVFQPGGGLWEH